MSSILLRIGFWAVVGSLGVVAGAAHAKGPAGPRLMISEGVSLTVPVGFSRETRELDGRADLLQLTDGSDVLVVVVYRRGADKAAPLAKDALEVHAREIALALGVSTAPKTERAGLRLLGKAQAMSRMLLPADGPEGGPDRQAWVVAADHLAVKRPAFTGDAARRTIVSSAVVVLGSPNAALFEEVVASIVSR